MRCVVPLPKGHRQIGVVALFAALCSSWPADADPIGMMTVGGTLEVRPGEDVQQALNGLLGISAMTGDRFVFSFGLNQFHVDAVDGPNVWVSYSGRMTLAVGSQNFSSDYQGVAQTRHLALGLAQQLGFEFVTIPELPTVITHGAQAFRASHAEFELFFSGRDLGLSSGEFGVAPVLLSNAPTRHFVFGVSVIPLCCPDAADSVNLLVAHPDTVSISSAPVPEPTSLLLLGTGLLAAAGVRRWRQRKT